MQPHPVRFKDHTADELHTHLGPLGLHPRLARQLQALVLKHRVTELPSQFPGAARRTLEQVRQATLIPQLTLHERVVSPTDGFTKYLFQGDGPQPFETVRIPLMHRPGDEKYIVCVSSQVGCAMECAFCATGRLGFQRNLETWEIVDQVVQVQADSAHPVRGVVFMGMGEPLLNYERVMRAAAIMAEPCGLAIDAKAITVSTVGIVPMIRRYTAEGRPYRLVVSLTCVEPEQRRRLLPVVEKTYPLPELLAAMREHHAATGRRITLAWTMMSGINTRPEDARLLAELTAGLPMRLDLIDVNDATGEFLPPGRQELDHFRDALREHLAMPIARRYSGGQDVHGGCGMLAGKAAGERGA
jgi:23S rRNA (adenine2503-C2)-methyltransferase